MDWTGPMGGALALAFGSGCVGGYGFAYRFFISDLKKRVETLEGRLNSIMAERLNDYKEVFRNDDA